MLNRKTKRKIKKVSKKQMRQDFKLDIPQFLWDRKIETPFIVAASVHANWITIKMVDNLGQNGCNDELNKILLYLNKKGKEIHEQEKRNSTLPN